jgi:endonuclease-3
MLRIKTKKPAPRAEIEERAREVARRLKRAIPVPACELRHESAWQLLVATILSAQSTDRRVNMVTPALFARYPTPAALGKAPQEAVERLVKSTGFYRNKAKSIRGASLAIAERHGGEVPRTIAALCELPGVARKTANVVLGTAYRIATGIVVDTHVARVSGRLGLTRESDPVKIEADLTALYPKRSWIDMGHRLLLHGRYICLAKRPLCEVCGLNEVCPGALATPAGPWTERARNEGAAIAAANGSGVDSAG